MDFMSQVYHDLKFHVNHFMVGYRQKYYSMDNNPRVIHTKLENQQLLSLRTFPNDKHLIGKGQPFLHLGRETEIDNQQPEEPQSCSTSSSSSSSLENVLKRDYAAFENYKNVTFRTHNSLVLKKNYSEPNLVDGYFSSFRLDLEMSGSSSEAEGDDQDNDNTIAVGPDQPLISLETETPGVVDSSECASSSPCTCQCHTIEKTIPESTFSSTKKTSYVKDKLYNLVMNSLPRVSTSTNEAPLEVVETGPPKDENVSLQPVIPQPENSIDEIMSIKQDSQQQPSNKIWKLVLNDISLSAARLSTGSANIPMVNNQNIRGDFIDAKITNNENEDIFPATNEPQFK